MHLESTASAGDSVTEPGVFFEFLGPLPTGPGDVLDDRYVVGRELGAGGEGVVFRAWDRRARRAVALKLLYPRAAARPESARRFERETELLRCVRHPNVCSILDFGRGPGTAFIVMELAVGDLLSEAQLQSNAKPKADWARRLEDARAVCRGVAAIHDAGIVHRDLKPANLLRMTDGRVVVADFGLAVTIGETASISGGTPNYLAPEVTRGRRHDARSDLWQLGIVLHELLLGSAPTSTQRHAADGLPAPRAEGELPPAVARWTSMARRCLSWDPGDRPTDGRAVVEALES